MMNLEYDLFIADLESYNLGHWAKEIERSGCNIIVAFQGEINPEKSEEYNNWCKENCNEKYFVYNEHNVFFKIEDDAMAFKLRWL